MKSTPDLDLKALRRKLGLNQLQFWTRLGVTQSGGSRYENGRQIPRAVLALLNLIYIEKIDLEGLKREDMQVIGYLKAAYPVQFAKLKKEMQYGLKSRRPRPT